MSAQRLEAAAQDALRRLPHHPAEAAADLVATLAGETLPEVRARLGSASPEAAARRLDLRLSEIANALSIVGLSRGFQRRRPREVELARTQIEKLLELLPEVAALGEQASDPAAADRARAELYFVAPPDRPATEAHVMRHSPRPAKVWSPSRPAPGR